LLLAAPVRCEAPIQLDSHHVPHLRISRASRVPRRCLANAAVPAIIHDFDEHSRTDDFSRCAERALDHACALASGSAPKIHVVNAIDGAAYTPGAPNPSWT
jgi:hypothetical protein